MANRILEKTIPFLLAIMSLGFIFGLAWGQTVPAPANQPSLQVLDVQKVVNTVLSAAGLLGVVLVFLNQRLTAREASRAAERADKATGSSSLITALTHRLERAEDRADLLGRELTEIRFKYDSHIDKLETELGAEKQRYEDLRQERHRVVQEAQAQALQQERERSEWQLRIQELEHSLAEEKKITAALAEKVAYLEKCIGPTGTGTNTQPVDCI